LDLDGFYGYFCARIAFMSKEIFIAPEIYFEKFPPSFDHDGVLADTKSVVVARYNKDFNKSHCVDEVVRWKTIAYWAMTELGMDEESANALDNRYWYQMPELLETAKPKPGAVKITKALTDMDIWYPVITSREPEYEVSTFRWYQREMPWISPEQIFIRPNSEMDGEIFKVWMVKLLKRGIHFEDAKSHAVNLLSYTDTTVAYISNDPSLDSWPKLIRFSGVNGRLPDMRRAYRHFFGRFV
jgi:hypothetical protein